jgi:hypothetical protein
MKVKGEHVFRERPKCPQCGRVFDACSTADRENIEPRPGDMMLCVYCGGLFVFALGLQLRPPEPAELAEIKQQCGGLTMSMAEASVEKYKSERQLAAIRHALYKAITGVYPEEHGVEDEPIEL